MNFTLFITFLEKSVRSSGDDACPVSADHAPIPTVSQSRSAEQTPLVVEEVLAVSEVSVYRCCVCLFLKKLCSNDLFL